MNPDTLQRAHALERANVVRFAQAQHKRDMRQLEKDQALRRAANLLLNPPDHVQRMRVRSFVCSVPGIGPTKAQWILTEAQVFHPNSVIGPGRRTNGPRAIGKVKRQKLASLLLGRLPHCPVDEAAQ